MELDGEVHEGEQQQAYDEARDAYLQNHNYVVLRFPNQRIFTDLEAILKLISNTAHMAPTPWLRSKPHQDKQ